MELCLRRHETRQTLNLQMVDTSTLRDLRQRVNPSSPYSVHLSLNRKDELLPPSPTLIQSLGVTSGDLIYFSPDPSAFVNDGSTMERLDKMHAEQFDAAAGSKRVSEPFFLKKILLEKCGETSQFTTLASSVHAVMLDSGFVLLNNHDGSERFSFSKEFLSVSLRYTLPELVSDTKKTTVEYVTVRFQRLGDTVVVYGSLSGYKLKMLNLDKNRFVPVIDLVMNTLKFEKQATSSTYRDVFVFWRMVKDSLCTPLLIGLCEKSGLGRPPCLLSLPAELKLKILELIPGMSVAKMACVCSEMKELASDNDLWRKKCLEESKHLVVNGFMITDPSVQWKVKFVSSWRIQRIRVQRVSRPRRRFPYRLRNRN